MQELVVKLASNKVLGECLWSEEPVGEVEEFIVVEEDVLDKFGFESKGSGLGDLLRFCNNKGLRGVLLL